MINMTNTVTLRKVTQRNLIRPFALGVHRASRLDKGEKNERKKQNFTNFMTGSSQNVLQNNIRIPR